MQPDNKPLISVIMPAFNEERQIRKCLERLVETIHAARWDAEIIVVNDGSVDATERELAAAGATIKELRTINFPQNKGKGEAVRAGFMRSRGSFVFFLDSDLDLPPEQLPTFWELLKSRGADAVIGSKYDPGSRVRYPAIRRCISAMCHLTVRLLSGLPFSDTQCGLKLFTRKVLAECIPLVTSSSFAYDLDLLLHAFRRGYRIIEAPVIINFDSGIGGARPVAIIHTIMEMASVLWRFRHAKDTHGAS